MPYVFFLAWKRQPKSMQHHRTNPIQTVWGHMASRNQAARANGQKSILPKAVCQTRGISALLIIRPSPHNVDGSIHRDEQTDSSVSIMIHRGEDDTDYISVKIDHLDCRCCRDIRGHQA